MKLTTERVVATVVQPLVAASTVLSSIPSQNIFQSDGVPLRIPPIKSVGLADPWRSENTQIAEVDPVIDDVVLLPSSLKAMKTISRVSNELVRHSVAPVGDVFGNALIAEIASQLDAAFLVGDGAGDTITGLVSLAGINEITSVGPLTVDVLHDAIPMLLEGNATPTHWYMAPRDLVGMRKLRNPDGSYVVQPSQTSP